MTGEAHHVLDDPRLRPFLPLLYAAWADGELTDGEIATLRTRITAVVDHDRSQALDRWLDPETPPPPNELAALAARIRSRARPEWQTLGPIELGLRLAGSVPDSVLETLRSLDVDLGPFGPTAVTALVDRSSPASLDPLPEKRPAPFDPLALRRLVDGPHSEVKERVRRILSRPDFSLRHGLSIAEHRQQVRTWLSILTEEGIGALGFPAEVGGAADPGGFMAAFSTLAHHDLSLLTKFGVQFGLFAGSVMRLGTGRHHPVVAGAIRLDPAGCFAMTEIGHGSNVAGLQTTATFLPGANEWEINTPSPQARKDYIGNAAVDGRLAVVFARLLVGELDHGVHAFLVPIRSETGGTVPGVTIADDGPKAGLNGVDNGALSFDRVRVPYGALLDRFASMSEDGTYHSPITSPLRRFFTTLGTLVGGRVSVASAAVSSAETALTIAIRYAWRRRQFSTDGGPENRLIDYRTHQRRLLTRLAATYAYHFAAGDLVEGYVHFESEPGDGGVDRRTFEGRAAGLKAFATWHSLDTIQECRQACGGQGYMAVNRLGPMRDDVDVFTTFEGDNTVLAQLLAKSLLTEHRAGFENLTPGRLVRYVAERVQAVVTETIPVIGSVGGELSDPDTCLALLERRSRLLVDKLALRVQARIDAGVDPGQAFLDVQPHAISAARAATELDVYSSVRRLVIDDPALAGLIRELGTLFALWRVEADLPWLMESGLVTLNGAKQVRAAVTSLCEQIAPWSLHLVDAFAIPDEVLAAPIAL